MGARVELPAELSDLLRSELAKAIYESALSREDTLIATRYFIEKVPQVDIAAELGYERSMITRRLPEITKRVSFVAQRLNFT